MIPFLAFIVSFFISYFLIPYIKKFGIRTNILAYPNERSVHEVPIPTMGGLSFFISFLFSFLLFGTSSSQKPFLLGAIIIFIVGLIDDSTDLKPIIKLLGQIIGVGVFLLFYIIIFPHSILKNPYILFLGYIFVLVAINAINLTDGLDGLAGGIFVISSLIFLYILVSEKEIVLLIFSLIGGVIGFLFFNFYPAFIFMGDTGSNFLGFSLGVLSLYTIEKYNIFPGILYVFLILSVPILDTVFAIIRRFIRKQPIFKADKGHVHHILISLGVSHPMAVIIIWILVALSFIPVFLVNFVKARLIPSLFIVFFYYFVLICGIIYINKLKKRGRKD